MPMQAQRVGGSVVPTHRQHRHYIEVDGQHQFPAAISPGKTPRTHCTGGWVGGGSCKISSPPGFDTRTAQPVASR